MSFAIFLPASAFKILASKAARFCFQSDSRSQFFLLSLLWTFWLWSFRSFLFIRDLQTFFSSAAWFGKKFPPMYFERNPQKSLRHKAHDATNKLFHQFPFLFNLARPRALLFIWKQVHRHNSQQMIEQILHLSHEIEEQFKTGWNFKQRFCEKNFRRISDPSPQVSADFFSLW